MFESNRQELAGQRDELRAALAHSQQKLSDAITRLEGVEKHSLLEIDRVRTEAQNKIASIEAKAKRESIDYTLEMARVNNHLRAEGQANHLAAENTLLVAASGHKKALNTSLEALTNNGL